MRNNIAIRLTDKQQAFLEAVISGAKPSVAAQAAGFVGNHSQIAWQLLHNPTVVAAIRSEINRRLITEALPLAYKTLVDLARDPATPAPVRRACARDLIDRAGFVAPKAQDPAGANEKPLSEMSSEELRALVDRLESELSARAIDVTPGAASAQQNAQGDANPLDFLD